MFSKTILSGNAGKDVELRKLTSGATLATFPIATSVTIKGKGGEMVDKTTWHKIVCWGQLAEKAAEIILKGKTVHVKGTISNGKYEMDGVSLNKTEIIADYISVNSIQTTILVGNAGKDAELRCTAGGTSVASFSLATSEKMKEDGVWKDKTTWHNIVCWGRTAEIAAEFVCKGKLVLVEGTISNSYHEKDGINHMKTEITADVLRLLSGGPKRG